MIIMISITIIVLLGIIIIRNYYDYYYVCIYLCMYLFLFMCIYLFMCMDKYIFMYVFIYEPVRLRTEVISPK